MEFMKSKLWAYGWVDFAMWPGSMSSVYAAMLSISLVFTWFGDRVLRITYVQNGGLSWWH
jgi:hypothetical protein